MQVNNYEWINLQNLKTTFGRYPRQRNLPSRYPAFTGMGYTKELIVALGAIAYTSNRESEFLGRTLDRLIGA